MKEQIISFETAKLAKEKGFNIKTFKAYIFRYKEHEHPNYIASLTKQPLQCDIAAPTQSLLQKWLREIHNIEVRSDVNFYNGKEKLGYFYSIDCFDENDIHDGKDYDLDQLKKIGKTKGFDTYEECLEKGLQEALKLI